MNSTTTKEEEEENVDNTLHFVIVPKVIGPFFDEVRDGCEERAQLLSSLLSETQNKTVTIVCHYIGPNEADTIEQARILEELISNPSKYNLTRPPDGISVAALDDGDITTQAINMVYDAGVAITTFDSDAPNSQRQVFIATDNYAFGRELGKVLVQLNPVGGYFGVITGTGPNLNDRLEGLRDRLLLDDLHPTNWKEVPYSPLNCFENITLALELMEEYATDPEIKAIIPIGGWPMFNPTLWESFVARHPSLDLVVADSTEIQLDLMRRGEVDGLVGQLPYQMGELSAQMLFDLQKKDGQNNNSPVTLETNHSLVTTATTTTTTHLLQIVRLPRALPPVTIDENRIGDLAILGCFLFGVIAFLSIVVTVWVWVHRKSRVILASQSVFLYMIGIGTLIMGSTIIPLSVDDSWGQTAADTACMSVPWLMSLGFTTSFAALFSKTWRVFRLVDAARRFQRVTITVRDVMGPFCILIMVNVITLLCWTLIAPLRYVRTANLGTDDWNRVISTSGRCTEGGSDTKGGSIPFAIILLSVDIGVLIIANIYAYKSRHIHTEYSESRYIAFVNGSILEAALIGIPVVTLVYDEPRPHYICVVLLIFVLCMAILIFIFYPKYRGLKEQQKKQAGNSQNGDASRPSPVKMGSMKCAIARQAVPTSYLSEIDNSCNVTPPGIRTSVVVRSHSRFADLKDNVNAMTMEEKRMIFRFVASYSKLQPLDREELLHKLETDCSQDNQVSQGENSEYSN